MALSARQAPLRNLVLFKRYAKARGCRITEALPESAPKRGAHSAGSWHYDTGTLSGVTHSLAADVNLGPTGTSAAERQMLTHLVVVAESMGLGVIFARDGVVGAAASHRGHLHVDIGSFSNTGKGSRRATPGDVVPWDTQVIIRSFPDNLAGPDTRKRLEAIFAASRMGGERFPYGRAFAQSAVGTKPDNIWGPNSRKAHDSTVRALKNHWKSVGLFTGTVNSIWDSQLTQAMNRFIRKYGR